MEMARLLGAEFGMRLVRAFSATGVEASGPLSRRLAGRRVGCAANPLEPLLSAAWG
jgi:hypothetical protein